MKYLFILLLVPIIKATFLSNDKVVELLPNTPIDFSEQLKQYFYVNLETYKEKEEGIISLKVKSNDDIRLFHAIYVTELKPEDYEKNIPITKTDFNFIPTYLHNYHHLYFRRNDSKPQPAILIYIEYNSVQTGSIVVSSKQKVSDVYSPFQLNKFEIRDFIPMIIKYTFDKKIDFGFYYMFFCNSVNYQTVYNGNLLPSPDNYKINTDTFFAQMYGYALPEQARYEDKFVITMIYFGAKKTIVSSVKNTYSKVRYFGGVRPKNEVFYYEVINAMEPFYILGEFRENTNTLIYFERLFGQFTMGYTNTFKGDSVESILPIISPTETTQFVISPTNIDIFAAQCTTPCGFNIHYVSDYTDTTLKTGDSKIIYLEKDKERVIQLADTTSVQVQMRKIGNTSGVRIKELDNEYRDLGELSFQTHHLDQTAEASRKLALTSPTATIIEIKVKTVNNYIACKDSGDMKTKYAIFELEESNKISEFEINISNNKKTPNINLYYAYHFGPIDFLDDPIINRQTNFNDELTLHFINPFLQKYPFNKFKDSKYYLLVRVEGDDQPDIKITSSQQRIPELDKLVSNQIQVIEKANQFILDETIGKNHLTFFTTKCNNNDVKVKLKYNQQTFKVFFIQNPFTMVHFADPFSKTSIYFDSNNFEESFAGLRVYYSYLSLDEIQRIDYNSDFHLDFKTDKIKPKEKEQDQNFANLELSWRSPLLSRVRYNTTYIVYLYHEPQKGNMYDICRDLSTFTLSATISSDAMDLTHKMVINQNLTNYIFVIAQPERDARPQFFYKTILIANKPLPVIAPDPPSLLWLYISIAVLGAICIGLAIGYIFVLQKKKNNIDLTKMPENEPLVGE